MYNNALYVRFYGWINFRLKEAIVKKLTNTSLGQYENLVLMISSQGGGTADAIEIYNHLSTLDINIVTHNAGAVQSQAIVVYCLGKRRTAATNSSFGIHAANYVVFKDSQYYRPQLDEISKTLNISDEITARIIAESTGQKEKRVRQDMLGSIQLLPTQAVSYGLVHEIIDESLPKEATVFDVFESEMFPQEKQS